MSEKFLISLLASSLSQPLFHMRVLASSINNISCTLPIGQRPIYSIISVWNISIPANSHDSYRVNFLRNFSTAYFIFSFSLLFIFSWWALNTQTQCVSRVTQIIYATGAVHSKNYDKTYESAGLLWDESSTCYAEVFIERTSILSNWSLYI